MSQGMWDLKKLMYLVQGSLCFYCWKPMTQEKEHSKAAHYATKDHLVPVSQGGPADWTNTILACQACNRVKADRLPTEAERARHGHLLALFNERVEIRREEIAAKEALKAAAEAAAAVLVGRGGGNSEPSSAPEQPLPAAESMARTLALHEPGFMPEPGGMQELGAGPSPDA